MVQPGAVGAVVGGAAFNGHTAPVQHNGAAHGQLWLAVVIAGLGSLRAFAGQALPALQQRRLGCVAAQVEPEAVALDPCEIAAAAGDGALSSAAAGRCTRGAVGQGGSGKRPVAQLDGRVGLAGLRHAKARAGDALVVVQALAVDVRQCRVGEQQLPGRKGRLHALRGIHPRAEKRHLKPPQPALGMHMAREVPPFGVQIRVATMVTGKLKGSRGQRQRIGRARPQGQRQPLAARAQGKAPGRRCEGHGQLRGWHVRLDWHTGAGGAGCRGQRCRPRRGVRKMGAARSWRELSFNAFGPVVGFSGHPAGPTSLP